MQKNVDPPGLGKRRVLGTHELQPRSLDYLS